MAYRKFVIVGLNLCLDFQMCSIEYSIFNSGKSVSCVTYVKKSKFHLLCAKINSRMFIWETCKIPHFMEKR